ncbi:hypothetical protein B9T16_30395, partial [Arthrospira sp. PCC 8006]
DGEITAYVVFHIIQIGFKVNTWIAVVLIDSNLLKMPPATYISKNNDIWIYLLLILYVQTPTGTHVKVHIGNG